MDIDLLFSGLRYNSPKIRRIKITGTDAYVRIGQVASITGRVIVQDVHISREGLALIMIEDQINALQKKMARRRREIVDLEEQQREDQRAINHFIQAAEELRKTRPY